MAQAVAQGAACEAGIACKLMHAAEVNTSDVLSADAYVWVTPETLGSMSGLMKDFFDRTYYGVLDRLPGRACAVLVCAGSDGQQAVRQIQRINTGLRLREFCEPLIVCTHSQTTQAILAEKTIGEADLARCQMLGASLAAGLEMGLF